MVGSRPRWAVWTDVILTVIKEQVGAGCLPLECKTVFSEFWKEEHPANHPLTFRTGPRGCGELLLLLWDVSV